MHEHILFKKLNIMDATVPFDISLSTKYCHQLEVHSRDRSVRVLGCVRAPAVPAPRRACPRCPGTRGPCSSANGLGEPSLHLCILAPRDAHGRVPPFPVTSL